MTETCNHPLEGITTTTTEEEGYQNDILSLPCMYKVETRKCGDCGVVLGNTRTEIPWTNEDVAAFLGHGR